MTRSNMRLLFGLWISALAAPAASAAERWVDPVSGLGFLKVPAGCFQMGSAPNRLQVSNQALRDIGFNGELGTDEQPRHEVCVSGYWLGETEVTYQAWARVRGEVAAAAAGAVDVSRPVVGVSWQDAGDFARRLTDLSRGAERFRLPTEAEWEMACLAGREDSAEGWKREAVHLRWMRQTLGRDFGATRSSLPVGKRDPNPWGFRDMLGNVWEWTQDAYDRTAYARHRLYDPRTDGRDGADRVIRGGSYRSKPMHLRCGSRGSYAAAGGLPHIGFRLVREGRR